MAKSFERQCSHNYSYHQTTLSIAKNFFISTQSPLCDIYANKILFKYVFHIGICFY